MLSSSPAHPPLDPAGVSPCPSSTPAQLLPSPSPSPDRADFDTMSIAANHLQQPAPGPPPPQSPPSQSSFTPPTTRPRQLLHNVINTPPPHQSSHTQLHPQPFHPPSPTSFQQRTSPPLPPPPPPPITTTGLNQPLPPTPQHQQPSSSSSSSPYYPPPSSTPMPSSTTDSNASASATSPTVDRDAQNSIVNLGVNTSTMSLNSQTDQQQDHEGIPASEWTMDKVVQWLQSKPQLGDEFIPLFLASNMRQGVYHTQPKYPQDTGSQQSILSAEKAVAGNQGCSRRNKIRHLSLVHRTRQC
ncbi:hypothetical protein B0O80DRAFT_235205 [Mortierella sp. GBAus27b]|nr:hypothetical protein B0O80DRAFT_235205 [Mortierella sp. GBAus27b]